MRLRWKDTKRYSTMQGVETMKFGAKKWFVFVISMLLITDIAILLNILFIRQIIGFLFLTILPGFLILQILKLDKIEFTEKFLLSVGLSISFLMFIGLFINILYPAVGVSKPISIFPLIITINMAILILCIIDYKKNVVAPPIPIYNYDNHIGKILSSPTLLILLIPLLSILGALVVRYYENSIFSMLQIAVIALIIALIGFGKFIPKRLYPSAVFMIGTALILNRTLTSPYLFGSDIHYEYYLHKLVEFNSYWNPTASSSNCNAMLSTVILPTIYSILLKIDGIWVYKVAFSLIFSLVPVGLYEIFRRQIGDKDAFLSAFLFMSFFPFFTVMSWLPRQQIAELFLSLFVLAMISKEMEPMKKSILLIIFITSLIVSHYGTTYIFLFYILMAFVFLLFRKVKNTALTTTFVTLSIVMTLSWYIYVSSSTVFNSIIHIGDHIYTSIATEMFSSSAIDPDIAKSFGADISELAPWHAMGHYWQITTTFLIAVGLVYAILKHREMKFDREYFLFSLISMVLLFMCIVLPYFASSLNINRIYPLTLFFLSPFCIIGAEAIRKMTSSLFKVAFLGSHKMKYLILMIILIPYFLFNTGFIFEVTEHPENFQLNINHVEREHVRDKSYFNWSYFIASPIPEQDVVSCRWMSDKMGDNPIYVDELRKCEVVGYGLIWDARELTPTTRGGKYIFLGYQNLKEGVIRCSDPKIVHSDITYNITEISPPLVERNKIYTNGGSEIYK